MTQIGSQKGTTLLEAVIAMSIFAIIMTIVSGFFIVIYRLQVNYRMTASLYQEARIVSEVISRQAREVKSITVSSPFDASFQSGGMIDVCDPSRYVEMELYSGSKVQFNCDNTSPSNPVRHFQMKEGLGGLAKPYLTSEHVSMQNFRVWRPNPNAYPQSIGYQFSLVKYGDPIFSENIYFRGYINVRSEK